MAAKPKTPVKKTAMKKAAAPANKTTKSIKAPAKKFAVKPAAKTGGKKKA